MTTLRADGSPHSTVVWVDGEGGDLLFNTARGRAKDRHLKADPRVAVMTIDENDFHRWLLVEGRATLIDDGADEHIDALAKRYMGVDEYPMRQPGEERVIVKIEPEKIQHMAP